MTPFTMSLSSSIVRCAGFALLVPLALALLLFVFTRIMAARIAAANPPSGAFVSVAGGRLHYTELPARGAERAVVALLHGASGNQADMMLPLGKGLSERGFRVFAFDRPGYGWSDRPDGRADADPRQQARLIHEALATLGVREAIVVGHSLAGMTSCALALDFPAFTRGLVLVSPVTHPWPGGGVDLYYEIAAAPVIGELFTETIALPAGLLAMRTALTGVYAPQEPPPGYIARAGLELVLRPASFRANAQDVAAAYAAVVEQAPRLRDIKAPTAIVTGDHDSVVLTKVHSYGSARDIPGATLTVLPGVGHAPHWAAPEAVIDAVDSVAKRAELAR
jgi:pimeloyl-ACP methyl ester carboxylesterase